MMVLEPSSCASTHPGMLMIGTPKTSVTGATGGIAMGGLLVNHVGMSGMSRLFVSMLIGGISIVISQYPLHGITNPD